jgi:hypothetical protein
MFGGSSGCLRGNDIEFSINRQPVTVPIESVAERARR